MFLSRVVKYIHLTLHIKRLTILTASLYPTNLLFQIIASFLIDCAFLVLWLIFFTRFPTLAGWGFKETALLLAIGWMSYALVAFSVGGVFTIAYAVSRGALDHLLLTPIDPLWHHVVGKTEFSACGNFCASLAMLYVSGYTNLQQIILFLYASLGAAILLFNIMVFVQSFVFYIGHIEIVSQQFLYSLMDTLFYPPVVFTGFLKVIVMTILPAYFIGFIPVQIVQTCTLQPALILLTSIIISSWIALSLFYKGVQRYESSSSMQVRL